MLQIEELSGFIEECIEFIGRTLKVVCSSCYGGEIIVQRLENIFRSLCCLQEVLGCPVELLHGDIVAFRRQSSEQRFLLGLDLSERIRSFQRFQVVLLVDDGFIYGNE